MSELGITVGIENSENSSSLNSTILMVFFTGIYTMIYFGTTYIYFTRNSGNRRLVLVTITLLFFTTVFQTGMVWYITKWEFINNGDTQNSIFQSLYDDPTWVELGMVTSQYVGLVLADGLLIWRCYFVWNCSVRVISVPLLLILTEIGLFVAEIVIHAIFSGFVVSPAQAATFDHVLAAGFFMSFATSLVTTILIAYRIHSVLKQEGVSARRFGYIMDIVVQSGVLYSIALLAAAIGGIVAGGDILLNTRAIAFIDYVQSFTSPVAGMSTTVLVARVAMLTPDTTSVSTSIHLSGLQFHAHSTHRTDPSHITEIAYSVNVSSQSIGEGQAGNGKVE